VPSLPHVVPSLPHVVPSLPHVVPSLPHVVPSLPHVVPSLPHVVPNLPHVVPSLPDVVPKLPDVVPSLPDVVPSLPDVVPKLPDIVPSLPDIAMAPRAKARGSNLQEVGSWGEARLRRALGVNGFCGSWGAASSHHVADGEGATQHSLRSVAEHEPVGAEQADPQVTDWIDLDADRHGLEHGP
jgi:hypothetical protein